MGINKRKLLNFGLIFLLIIILFFFIYYFSYPRVFNGGYISNSGDENLNLFFSKLYSETGSLSKAIESYSLPEYIFMPRDGAIISNNIVPQGFLGVYILGGTIVSLDSNIIFLITPLASILTLLIFYLICLRLFSKKIALISFFVSLLSISFWWNASSVFFNHIFALFFYLLGILYFFKFLDKDKYPPFILFSLFFGMAIFFRYIYLIFVLPIILYLAFHKSYIKKLLERKYLIGLLFLILFLSFPLLYLNNSLYGDPTKVGYSISSSIIANITGSGASQFQFDSSLSYNHLKLYFFNLNLVLIPFIFIGMLVTKFPNKKIQIFYMSNLIFIFFIVLLYISGKLAWGQDSMNLNASFIKYSLILYILLIPFVANSIARFNKKIILFLLFSLLIFSFITAVSYPNGLIDNYKYYEKNKIIKENILGQTENNSIIISRYSDKLIFPNRQVVIASLLNNLTEDELKDNALVKGWDVKISEEELSYWINDLYNKNSNLYLFDDGIGISENKLNDLLMNKGLKLDFVNKPDGKNLYKINPFNKTNETLN